MIATILIVSFLASLLKFFTGFGLGTVLLPVMAIFFPVHAAIAITAMVHLLSNIFKLALLWRHVSWRLTWRFGIPALLAALPGAWLLSQLGTLPEVASYQWAGHGFSITPLKLLIGSLMLIFATWEGLDIGKRFIMPVRYLPIGGVLSGFFGGLSGHQGAFRSAFLLHARLGPQQFIATNAAIASLVDLSRIIVYGIQLPLLMQPGSVNMLLLSISAAFAGVLAGNALVNKVTMRSLQRLVMMMLYLLGLLLMMGAI